MPAQIRVRDIEVHCGWTESYKTLKAMIRGFFSMPWPMRIRITQRFYLGGDISGILADEW
jgi:hypothetical protein